jgi:hypothetical protein
MPNEVAHDLAENRGQKEIFVGQSPVEFGVWVVGCRM